MSERYRIKPLVWTLYSCPTPFEYCDTMFGMLQIHADSDGQEGYYWQLDGEFPGDREFELFANETDAKIAAEGWYRERLLDGALEPVEEGR